VLRRRRSRPGGGGNDLLQRFQPERLGRVSGEAYAKRWEKETYGLFLRKEKSFVVQRKRQLTCCPHYKDGAWRCCEERKVTKDSDTGGARKIGHFDIKKERLTVVCCEGSAAGWGDEEE